MTLIIGSTQLTVIQPSVVNVKDYGAIGDNSHDDTSAIAAAIAAYKANVNAASGSYGGQTLFFPPGFYKTTSTLDLSGLPEARVLGGSGRGGGSPLAADTNPPTCINFLPGGGSSATALNLADAAGLIWDGVSVWGNSPTYAGILMDFDASGNHAVFGNRVQNCQLRCPNAAGAILASLDGNIEFSFDNVTFSDAGATGTQLRGFNAASGNAKWCNANSLRSCTFLNTREYSILDMGPQTTYIDCTFEASGTAAAPLRVDNEGEAGTDTHIFTGCGFWDVTTGATPWLQATVATQAWSFHGCRFDCPPTGPTFDLSSHSGLALNGCYFNSPGGGTPNIFKPGQNITNGSMLGCYVKSPVVDNHSSVFV